MAKRRRKKQNRWRLPLLLLLFAVCCGLLFVIFRLRGQEKGTAPEPSAVPVETAAVFTPAPTPEPTADPAELQRREQWAADAQALRLSELMTKNRTTLQDKDGEFPDWIELENISDRTLDLSGWRLSDKESAAKGWTFPAVTLGAGERIILFASGKDLGEGGDELHTDFSLSEDERLSLFTPDGGEVFSLRIPALDGDCSLIPLADGSYGPSAWPTPGQPNSPEGYEAWQQSSEPKSPLQINEAMPANLKGVRNVGKGLDWVELKNVSDQSVELSDYYLSDDRDDYRLWQLPEGTLQPGRHILIVCDKDSPYTDHPCAPFSLNAVRETLYLSTDEGLCDCVSLHDVPFGGSCGRMDDEKGFFYFTQPTPNAQNANGVRRVSVSPAASLGGGLYDGTESLSIALDAPGTIFYTLDGSHPTEDSERYEGPIELKETTILRAVALEDGALPSSVLTESYFINEGHTLPVVSLVADKYPEFLAIYKYKATEAEIPGSIAFYEADGSFRAGCGITMSGATSLELPKKNVSVHFRGAYGDSKVNYDIFGGGVDSFESLAFRAGQDYYTAIIRTELMQNLALQMSPEHVITQRSRYCVLYVNGNYYGIYALKDKLNRSFFANWAGVSKESISDVRNPVATYLPFGRDVYLFARDYDMRDPKNYETLCQRLDVDSLIDWAILEGYCTNSDIASGNLRYVSSTESDGRWRTVFYDLDITLRRDFGLFYNLIGPDEGVRSQQVTMILLSLLRNQDFRARFLERAAAAFYGPLSDANVLAEIDRLYAELEPELPRDFARWGRETEAFEEAADRLRTMIGGGFAQKAVDDLCTLLNVSAEEKEYYFPRPFA